MAWHQFLLAGSVSFIAATAGAQAEVATAVLTLDMPHGACRLTIRADGAAELAHGALPAWIEVRPGTFEPRQVLATFQAIAKPGSHRAALKPPVGALTFHPNEELQWFNESAPAHALFRRALENRSPTQSRNLYPAAEAIIANACSAG